MKTIDVCGLSCPEPVVRTQAALKKLATGEALEVVADSVTARENVARTARAAGYAVAIAERDGQFSLTLTHQA